MKTLYSSTFLTIILAFLALLGSTGTPVVMIENGSMPAFQTIIDPVGPALAPMEQGKVKVEVFNTFGCQSCDLFGQGVLPQLVEKYGSDNADVDLRLILIPNRESESELYATRGTYCGAKYDQFWDMTYKIHALEEVSKREIDLLGQEMDMPVTEFRKCLDSDEFDEKIGEDIAYAETRKIAQKPTILVNGTILLGDQPIENIERVIKQYVNR